MDGQAAAACAVREVTEQARNQRRLALADEASARIGPRLANAGAADLLAGGWPGKGGRPGRCPDARPADDIAILMART
jgi:hypothetical protein